MIKFNRVDLKRMVLENDRPACAETSFPDAVADFALPNSRYIWKFLFQALSHHSCLAVVPSLNQNGVSD